jgi:hypothetical protein
MATKEKPSFATETTMPACLQTGHSRKIPFNFKQLHKKYPKSSTHFGVEFADYIIPRAIPGVIHIFVFQTNYYKRFFLPLYA